MSIAPVVLRSRSAPFLSIACLALVAYFVIKALVFGGGIGLFSVLLAAVAAVVGVMAFQRRRSSVVTIDRDVFTITHGSRSTTYQRSDVANVDLSALDRHLTLTDGTPLRLPLDSAELIEAGLLLSPVRG